MRRWDGGSSSVPPWPPGLPSRLLLGFSGRATTQQALGMPSSSAAPRRGHGGFCGCLLPSRFPGLLSALLGLWSLCSSPARSPPCVPLAPSPGCSPPVLVIEVSQAAVVQQSGDWEQAWSRPGATQMTREQDGVYC